MPSAPLVDGRRLRLSNLDKVLYPDAGTTKGDAIHYYATMPRPSSPTSPNGP